MSQNYSLCITYARMRRFWEGCRQTLPYRIMEGLPVNWVQSREASGAEAALLSSRQQGLKAMPSVDTFRFVLFDEFYVRAKKR
jgi:hypothetical protein